MPKVDKAKLGSRNFTNQEPFTVTEEDLKLPWSGRGRVAFGCDFCMKPYAPGDIARWTLSRRGPNFWVCVEHDDPDRDALEERWAKRWAEIKQIVARWGGGNE